MHFHSSRLSVCLSLCKNSGLIAGLSRKFINEVFSKMCRIYKIFLKLNRGYFALGATKFMMISRCNILRSRNISDAGLEKMK